MTWFDLMWYDSMWCDDVIQYASYTFIYCVHDYACVHILYGYVVVDIGYWYGIRYGAVFRYLEIWGWCCDPVKAWRHRMRYCNRCPSQLYDENTRTFWIITMIWICEASPHGLRSQHFTKEHVTKCWFIQLERWRQD